MTKQPRKKSQRKPSAAEQEEWNKSQCLKLIGEGQYGKASQVLNSAGLAPTSASNLGLLRACADDVGAAVGFAVGGTVRHAVSSRRYTARK